MLDVTLLGGLRFRLNGKDVRLAGRPRVVPLLAYLLLNCRQPVVRDIVAFALWPDESEETARANLRRHLHYVRELLPPSKVPWLITERQTVCWNPAALVCVDVIDFERSAANSETLRKAVELYAELLPAYDDEWIVAVRERLRQTYLQSLHELAHRARGRRDCAAASDYLTRILADDPWREDALRALMAVRCESGDRASALQLFAQFERRLKAEMGVAVMPETSALYRSIEQGEPLPAVRIDTTSRVGTTTFTDLPFQGRAKELERLRSVWERVAAGSGALTLILGEAGIGKTRLAREFALDVEAGGGRVLWGTTSSPETVPYQAVVEIIRAALTFIESLSLESYELAILSRIVPELRRELQDDPGGEPDAVKLFDLVGDLFGEIARDRPMLVVLEDLHGAGPATITMLERVVQKCRGRSILILATSREEEAVSANVLSVLRRPVAGGKPSVIPLGPLSEHATRSIVNETLGSGAAARWVTQRCGGHPLFLAELLNAAADVHGSVKDALPTRLREVINERTRRLSPEARMVLRAAAVVGTSFDLEIVAEIVGWSEGPLADAVDELVARRIVRQRADPRPFEYEFAHELIAASVYESVPDRERRRCHRRAAQAAERWYASRLNELSGFIANHFELGGVQNAAGGYYLRAARAASSSFANGEALAYARRGLQLSPDSPIDRFNLCCVMEEVLARTGERKAQHAVLRDLNSLARRIGDSERLREVLWRRERLYRFLNKSAAAREAITRLKELAAGNARWEAIALRDEAALQMNCASQTAAYETVTRAVQRARTAEDAATLVLALTLRAHLAASLGYQEEAMASLRSARETAQRAQSVILRMRVAHGEMTVLTRFQAWLSIVESSSHLFDLAAKCGSTETSAGAHLMLGGALVSLFKITEARRHLREAIESYRRCDLPGLFIAYNNLATAELEVGRLDRAERALAAMETAIAQSEYAYGRVCAKLLACELAAHRDDHAVTIVLAENTITAAHALGDALFEGEALRCKGIALRESGRAHEAVCTLEESLEVQRRLALGLGEKRATAELSLACALDGDRRAAPFADSALELCSRDAPAADSPVVLWPLAQALALLGRDAQARAILRRAHDAFVRRRKRLRNPRDRAAFTAQLSNAALARAYTSAFHTRTA